MCLIVCTFCFKSLWFKTELLLRPAFLVHHTPKLLRTVITLSAQLCCYRMHLKESTIFWLPESPVISSAEFSRSFCDIVGFVKKGFFCGFSRQALKIANLQRWLKPASLIFTSMACMRYIHISPCLDRRGIPDSRKPRPTM